MASVTIIDMTDLAGHDVKIDYRDGQNKPFWYRVSQVYNAISEHDIGRRWYLYGKPIDANGQFSIGASAQPVVFVSRADVIKTRRTPHDALTLAKISNLVDEAAKLINDDPYYNRQLILAGLIRDIRATMRRPS